jgi:hypothetical protein
MQDTTYIADELVLEPHPDGPYILLRREGKPSTALGRCISTRCAVWQGLATTPGRRCDTDIAGEMYC